MRFRRQGRFSELVERQLDLFAADDAELLAEAAEAEGAWNAAAAEDAEEAYGDYQLVVDAIADRLLDIRESYAHTLDEDGGVGVQRRSSRARRPGATDDTRRCWPIWRTDAAATRRLASARRHGSERIARLQELGELEVRRRLPAPTLSQQRPSERVVRVVVDGRELEHLAELALGRGPVGDPEVGDPERLPDRRLLRLEPPRLLERHRRLRGEALAQPRPPELVEVVRLAHRLYRA